jgi:hypothetical protein
MSGYSKVTDSSVKSRLKAIGVSINSTPASLRKAKSFIVCPLPKRALALRHHNVLVHYVHLVHHVQDLIQEALD